MFTGLVEETGVIEAVSKTKEYKTLTISLEKIIEELKIGDSVAVNGVCLTVTNIKDNLADFNVMAETVSDTSLKDLKKGSLVNLERALTLNDRLGGHIVSGHVDTIGKIKQIKKVKDAFNITIEFAKEFEKYVVEKGSIAIDGISLTIQEIKNNSVTVGIIPHTLENTSLKNKKAGDHVNLEFDILGKYIEKMLSSDKDKHKSINKFMLG